MFSRIFTYLYVILHLLTSHIFSILLNLLK